MKLKYLGTAAAEGFPGMFCTCDSCARAWKAGGRNIRTRSQALVDDSLLIDFPADTYLHVLNYGLDLTKIKDLIITHNHSDHLYSPDFEMRRAGFAYLQEDFPLTVYGTEPAGNDSQKFIEMYHLDKDGRVLFNFITPYVPFQAGRYTITPLKADHDPDCDPVFYIVSDGRKTLLYAHDTGYFPQESWSYLEKSRPHFDFVSIDCTNGILNFKNNHMGIVADAEVKERLLEMGCADQHTVFCANHFSHNGKATYDEMAEIAKEYGILVSYDGMTVEI